jgi:hypothetical protein
MPYMTNGHRDYKKEYAKYAGKPAAIHARSERTTLRRQANAAGITHKGDGKDLDHIRPLSKGGANKLSNTRVVSKHQNRSFSRNSDGSLKRNDGKSQ